jgi:hypothetical protein
MPEAKFSCGSELHGCSTFELPPCTSYHGGKLHVEELEEERGSQTTTGDISLELFPRPGYKNLGTVAIFPIALHKEIPKVVHELRCRKGVNRDGLGIQWKSFNSDYFSNRSPTIQYSNILKKGGTPRPKINKNIRYENECHALRARKGAPN